MGIRLSLVLTAVLAAVLGACSPRVSTHGNLPDPDLLADIEVGHVNKNEVARILGTPSSVAPFDSDTWYYVSEKTKTVAFFEPEVTERKIIIIRFDKRGMVKEFKTFGLEEAKQIEMVERKTPTAGNELGLLRQMFGNIGRFEGKGGK
ncbi:MAG: outer membrane protein assembly factor BamE [Rhodospirillales bacterium]|jgi:outer membrane protein assembly factor BamE (lipoprotein component of BamABCDE complex)|nr:cell envelope protein SmpA [Rhodospirillaceae bacterium]MDP6427994.1 outer membrane protein assembly factor BamE [Rhodospirillales bacterium]MDP6646030.1 outer membrane protein assembly factor BamE [Rhodospirillales bacterium]MDP6842805.1 outer membrane protein assembly factor BamE [Rhodospirillales bacterium]|tara:strand:+ start:5110 stop:5553 length:444 start_codon:yes stop_codon:yes gene_type:complete